MVADLDTQIFRQAHADADLLAIGGQRVEIAGDDLALERRVAANVGHGHATHQHALDPPLIKAKQGLLDQRGRAGDARRRLRFLQHIAPVGQAPAIALHHGMAVEADNLVEQLRAEPVHDAHDDDERGDSEHDRGQADAGDEEDEAFPLARQQIALGDHAFVAG